MFLLNRNQQSYLNYITFLNEKDKPHAATDDIIKHSGAISKSVKVHWKPPQSFTTVIELLLESIITFVPPSEDKAVVGESSLVIDMEIDVALSKGKGKATASRSEEKEDTGQESSQSLAKNFLPHSRNFKREKKTDADWRHKLAEVNNAFSVFADNCKVQRSLGNDIQAFFDLLNDVLAAQCSPRGSLISREASATFIDVCLVRSLTRTLHMLDLDHADSLKVAPTLVKVLELVTKEHIHAVEANATKADNQAKPSGHLEHGEAENTGGISQSTENASLPNASSAPAEVIESFSTVQAFGGSEFVTDDMEHDQDIDGGYAPPSEDDYMHETSEETRGLDNGLGSVEIRFEIQPD
ncbi:hypothetical protein Tco_1470831, partial [Tanacetum coccineum]